MTTKDEDDSYVHADNEQPSSLLYNLNHVLSLIQEWGQDAEEWARDMHQDGQYWSWRWTVSPVLCVLRALLCLCSYCQSHTHTHACLRLQMPQSRGAAVVGPELRDDAALVGGPGDLPGVPALGVQRGQPALLVGLRGAEEGDQPHRGGWEGQDYIRRLRVHIIAQRGSDLICVNSTEVKLRPCYVKLVTLYWSIIDELNLFFFSQVSLDSRVREGINQSLAEPSNLIYEEAQL